MNMGIDQPKSQPTTPGEAWKVGRSMALLHLQRPILPSGNMTFGI